MSGIRRRSNRKPEMEASLRSLRVQKPLADCSNTVTVTDSTAAASTQSSAASTGGTVKRQNPALSSVTKTLLASLTSKNDAVASSRGSDPSTAQVSSSVSGTSECEVSEPPSVYSRRQTAPKRKSKGKENDVPFSCPPTPKIRNVGKKAKKDGSNIPSEMDTTPIASTPSPRVSSSSSDPIDHNVFEPSSVYSRRQSAQKKKSEGKKNIGASSCPPVLKTLNTWRDNSIEVGPNCPSKKSKVPHKAKVLPAKKTCEYTSPELEKQRAYFAELDKYELPVEEAEEWELD